MELSNKFDTISESLNQSGASTFASLLYNIPRLYRPDGNYTVIFAPSNQAFQSLTQTINKSISELSKSNVFIDMLYRHLTEAAKSHLIDKDIVTTYNIGQTQIWIINIVIIYQTELDTLSVVRAKSDFNKLPASVLMYMINTEQITGKDLIGLCLTSFTLNEWCNSMNEQNTSLFDRLLLKEFGIKSPFPGGKSARDYYVEMHSGYRLFTSIDFHNKYGGVHYGQTLRELLTPVLTHKKIKFVDQKDTSLLFIDIDNKAWAIGDVQSGKLGIGNIDPNVYTISVPTPIVNVPNAKYLSCAMGHSAVIDMNGRLWMFGSNFNGALGLDASLVGANDFTYHPIMVPSIQNATKVKCYDNKTVVMTADGKVYESYFGKFRDYLEVPVEERGRQDNVDFSGYKCINICQPDRTILCEDVAGTRYVVTGNEFSKNSRHSRPVPPGTIDVLILKDGDNYFLTEYGEVVAELKSGNIPNPTKDIIIEEPTIFGIQKQIFPLKIPFVAVTTTTGSNPSVYLLDQEGAVYTVNYTGELQKIELPSVVRQLVVDNTRGILIMTILVE